MPATNKSRPTQLFVGPLVYTITYDMIAGFDFGVTDHNYGTIKIRNDLTPSLEKETLMHEMLHCVWMLSGFGSINDKEEEAMVSVISPWLLMVLSSPNNKEFVEYVTQ